MRKLKGRERELIEAQARKLVHAYCPNTVMAFYDVANRPDVGSNLTTDAGGQKTIYWCPDEGLTILLHEIGHRIVEQSSPVEIPAEYSQVTQEMLHLLDEALAWSAAEHVAERECIWFDYALAEKKFGTYTGKAPLRLRWRKK